MRKKKEYPRKRKRFVKKIIFLSVLLGTVFLLALGTSFYFLVMKLQKPLYVSPLPIIHSVQANDTVKNKELQKALEKEQIAYSSITVDGGSSVVTLQNGSKVTFSSQKDIMTQIASLQYILSHLTMEGRQFSTLDFRFDKPVVVVKP